MTHWQVLESFIVPENIPLKMQRKSSTEGKTGMQPSDEGDEFKNYVTSMVQFIY